MPLKADATNAALFRRRNSSGHGYESWDRGYDVQRAHLGTCLPGDDVARQHRIIALFGRRVVRRSFLGENGEVVMIDALAYALVAVALSLPALITATTGLE